MWGCGVGVWGWTSDWDTHTHTTSPTPPNTTHTPSNATHTPSNNTGVAYAAAEYTGVPTAYQPPEYDEYIPFDCCDRSINVWETLLPLVSSSAAAAAATQGLDFIAP